MALVLAGGRAAGSSIDLTARKPALFLAASSAVSNFRPFDCLNSGVPAASASLNPGQVAQPYCALQMGWSFLRPE